MSALRKAVESGDVLALLDQALRQLAHNRGQWAAAANNSLSTTLAELPEALRERLAAVLPARFELAKGRPAGGRAAGLRGRLRRARDRPAGGRAAGGAGGVGRARQLLAGPGDDHAGPGGTGGRP
ncbi:hypothetical protein ACFFQW_16040 [Umezawaea endophytica]|uniref:Uncharacterized protein n=1 Tax=Umezawaea endophytica TaxID=1654476 RepID=A0A9X2VT50_9PSEU|nr:hypothetical protein [Umezawaea endophytica]MCS7481629.1 hypothetical protein [Umezawaea endophytica]